MYWIGTTNEIEQLNYDVTGFLILNTPQESYGSVWAKTIENKDKTQAAIPVCEKYKQENQIKTNIKEVTELPDKFENQYIYK